MDRQVPIGWRTNIRSERLRLSRPMRRALCEALDDGHLDCGKHTVRALAARGLASGDGNLTERGKVVAVAECSLRRQCEVLGLPLETVTLAWDGRPELAALAHLQHPKARLRACYAEGGLLVILYCVILEEVRTRLARHSDHVAYDMYAGIMSYARLLEWYPDLPQALVGAVAKSTERLFLRNFDRLKAWQSPQDWALRDWKGLDRGMALAIYRSVPTGTFLSLAKTFFSEPFAYTAGWPDLICVDEQGLWFTEVKTTDRIHRSQVVTIPMITDQLKLPVRVLRLRRKKS